MKKIILLLSVIFVLNTLNAQPPKVQWAKAIGGTGNDRSNSIVTDSKGNIVLVGRFQSKAMLVDHITLKKSSADMDAAADVFIIKLDKNGKALWALSSGSYGDDHALSCTTDKDGNIYVVGWFESDTLRFDDVILKNNNFTAGKDSVRYNSDLWLAKFSPLGKCIWARNAGGLDGNGQYSTVTLDKYNNVIISGIAGAEMNFGNGVKLSRETPGMFVAKYTNDGQLLWVKSPLGTGEAQGVSTDTDGNIFIGGYFVSTISFDDVSLKSCTEKKGDAFVAKYSPSGKAIWARNFGGENGEIASCESDRFGNVYLSGLFFSRFIAAGSDTLKNNGSINHFIAKYDKEGKLLWAKSAGGNNGQAPATASREFFVDQKGNAFCTGSNWSEFTFASQTIKTVSGSEDIFLLKYDKDGNEVWGVDYGGSGRNAGRGVATDKKGNIFLCGSFDEQQLKIDSKTLVNSGESDIFIVKFCEQK